MKNIIEISREFGEVTIQACLPSVEDFLRRASRGVSHAVTPTPIRNFYCTELERVYDFDFETVMRDFEINIEKKKLLEPNYSWGEIWLVRNNSINMVPFVSVGIGTPKTLKFVGMYSEEMLQKVMETLQTFVEYVKDFRKVVNIKFEVQEEEPSETTEIIL